MDQFSRYSLTKNQMIKLFDYYWYRECFNNKRLTQSYLTMSFKISCLNEEDFRKLVEDSQCEKIKY